MYTQYFRLKQEPFSIAPDPRFLFMSGRHREALAHLLYGLGGGGGFVLLSGEIGAGKTTVCRCFLEQVPKRCNVAYIFNPKLTVPELLKTVCDEFGIPLEPKVSASGSVKEFVDRLNRFLLETHAVGQNNVLVIDEAQNLSPDVLEQLRLLTNLETDERKLLQIILIGQPELRAMLARPELEQLEQRVIARFHLDALSETETAHYIRHRMGVAGATGVLPFDREARKRIHELSRGIPRRINLLCDRALLGAYASNLQRVNLAIVEKAAQEVFDSPAAAAAPWWHERRRVVWGVGAVAAVAALSVAAWLYEARSRGTATAVAASTAPAATRDSAPAGAASAVAAAASAVPTQAAAVSAPMASTPAELQSRLAPLLRDENEAWRALAPAWKLEPGEGDVCQAAQREQLQCFKSTRTSLALIRQLDRPGVLTLQPENDKAFHVLLTGLTAHSATLRGASSSQTVSLELLTRLWRGEFATFWRAPPGTQGKVGEGNTGAAAVWLASKLDGIAVPVMSASAAASAAASSKPLRPSPLKARVHDFQLAQGLEADGVIGPTTFMQLNRALGIDEPRLQAQR